MSLVWKEMMFGFSGWFKFVAEPLDYVKMFLFVFIGYLVVMFFDFRRIKRIPMDEALKNVE
jgi:putative ABC transport system permease protein